MRRGLRIFLDGKPLDLSRWNLKKGTRWELLGGRSVTGGAPRTSNLELTGSGHFSNRTKKWPEIVRRISGRCKGRSLAFLAGVLDAQVVGDLTETQASLTRADPRDILFHLIVDHALERHVAVIHDDVDGRYGLDGVA